MPEGLGGLGGLFWDMDMESEDEEKAKAYRNLAISRLVKKTLLDVHGDLQSQKLNNPMRVQRNRNLKPDLGTLWKTRVG